MVTAKSRSKTTVISVEVKVEHFETSKHNNHAKPHKKVFVRSENEHRNQELSALPRISQQTKDSFVFVIQKKKEKKNGATH